MSLRQLRWCGLLLLALAVTGCAGAGATAPTATPPPTATPDPAAGELVEIGEYTALVWGTGNYGVVIVGSSGGAAATWQATALTLAGEDMTVLAPNDYSYRYVVDAIDYLVDERGVDGVALIGIGAGAPPVIGAGIIAPEKVDQMILVSGFGEYQDMGDFPKLFIAADSESGMVRRARTMAEEAPGTDNEALIIPGSAGGDALFTSDSSDDLMAAITARLEQYRR